MAGGDASSRAAPGSGGGGTAANGGGGGGAGGASGVVVRPLLSWGRAVLVFIGLTALGIVIASLYFNTAGGDEPNGCGMSYFDLVEYPFHPQPNAAPDSVPIDHPDRKHQHKLFRYIENGQNKTGVHRVPILFIHGNSGSYRQSRSIAARLSTQHRTRQLAAQAAGKRGDELVLDYFTVDFSEEKSAFSGRLAWRQASYINECIRLIRSQYPDKRQKVLLIGHSMGGIVARGVFLLPNYVPDSVTGVLTLGTPHQDPFIVSDRELQHFYEQTNRLWATAQHPTSGDSKSENSLSDVILLSISGGYRDHLIEPHLADTSLLVPPSHALAVVTTAIPNVRLTVDHQCLCWCYELVDKIAEVVSMMTNTTDPLLATDEPTRIQRKAETDFDAALPYWRMKPYERVLTSSLRRIVEPIVTRWREPYTNPTPAPRAEDAVACPTASFHARASAFGDAKSKPIRRVLEIPASCLDRMARLGPDGRDFGVAIVLRQSAKVVAAGLPRIASVQACREPDCRVPSDFPTLNLTRADMPDVVDFSSLVSPLELKSGGAAARGFTLIHKLFVQAKNAKLYLAFIPVDAAPADATASAAPVMNWSQSPVAGSAASSNDPDLVSVHLYAISNTSNLAKLLPEYSMADRVKAMVGSGGVAGAASASVVGATAAWGTLPLPLNHAPPAKPAPATAASFWSSIFDPILQYTVDTQSFQLTPSLSNNLVYYWESKLPSGVDRFYEFTTSSSPGAEWACVYISSEPKYKKERLMYEDDFSLIPAGTKIVRFHRSNVARIVRAVFILPPSSPGVNASTGAGVHVPHTYHFSISVLSVRSFLRTVYSKFTTVPPILIATAFLLIALQYRHYLRYGVFQRFYHIFGFGQRQGALRPRRERFSWQWLVIILAVWMVSVVSVVLGGGPFSSAYLRWHSEWVLEWIWLVAIGFIFVSGSCVVLIGIEALVHGLFGTLSILTGGGRDPAPPAALPSASPTIGSATLGSPPASVVAGRGAADRPHASLFRISKYYIVPITLAIWYAAWDPHFTASFGATNAAPWLVKLHAALHSNLTLTAMLLTTVSSFLLLVIMNVITWNARAPWHTRSFRAYKVTCFMLYMISVVGSLPSWVFEASSSSSFVASTATPRPAFPFSFLHSVVDLLSTMCYEFDFETWSVLVVNGLVVMASLHFPPRPVRSNGLGMGTVASTPRNATITTPTAGSGGGAKTSPALRPPTSGNSPALVGGALASPTIELDVSMFSIHSLPSLLCLCLAILLVTLGRDAFIWLPLLAALVVGTLLTPQGAHALFHHILPTQRVRAWIGRRTSGVAVLKPANGAGAGGMKLPAPLRTEQSDAAAHAHDSPTATATGHAHVHSHSPGHECCPMSPELQYAPPPSIGGAVEPVPNLEL